MPKVFKPNLIKKAVVPTSGKNSVPSSPFPEYKSPSINDFIASPRKRIDLQSPVYNHPTESSPQFTREKSPSSPKASAENNNSCHVEPKSPQASHEVSCCDLDKVMNSKNRIPQTRIRKSKVFEPIENTSSVSIRQVVSLIPKSNPSKHRADRLALEKTTEEVLEETKDVEVEPEPTIEPSFVLDADGNIVVNETANKVSVDELIAKSKRTSKSVFESDPLNCYSNMNSYRKNPIVKSQPWSREENLQFYRCLSTFGQDFSLIQHLFPEKNYVDIKRKFKLEEKKNPHLINSVLKNPKSFDLSAFYIDDDFDAWGKHDTLPVSNKPVKKVNRAKRRKTISESSHDSNNDQEPLEETQKPSPSIRRSMRNLCSSHTPSKKLVELFESKTEG